MDWGLFQHLFPNFLPHLGKKKNLQKILTDFVKVHFVSLNSLILLQTSVFAEMKDLHWCIMEDEVHTSGDVQL